MRRRDVLTMGAAAAGLAVLGGQARANADTDTDTDVALGPATVLARAGSAYSPAFFRYAFSGNTAAAGSDRWAWQVLQGDRAKPAGVDNLFVYATAVQRPSDPRGITQCMPPSEVRDEWFLRDQDGQKIHRGINGVGGDYALDVGHPGFRARAASFLVDKCRRENWDGVLHDEINGELTWAFHGARSARYPTSEAYRRVQLDYIRFLRGELAAAGLRLAGNIGESIYRAWCEDLTRAGMITMSETFVSGNLGRSGPMSSDDGQWTRRVDWLEWSVANAPAVFIQDRQNEEGPITYGLATFLLADNGRGAYGASTAYSGADPWRRCFTAAQQLGAPTGPRQLISGALWRRGFEHGHVLVNAARSATTYHGVAIAPTSGRIIVG